MRGSQRISERFDLIRHPRELRGSRIRTNLSRITDLAQARSQTVSMVRIMWNLPESMRNRRLVPSGTHLHAARNIPF